MKNDLLYQVFYKNLSDEKAMELFDKTVEEFHESLLENDIASELKLSQEEYTAIVVWSVDIEALANFRYFGWPNSCIKCSKSLNVKEDGWKLDDENNIRCVTC
ncbi:hypothetical protein FZC79_08400 [Rossellomorea vietnamensis]|uniref:Uncharacterized protein n=2 Tax=Rossellomorea TaxID=2837508 RepID=A0A5D4KFU5_9BACI|nr:MULTISPECIES: hypothetical protein [Rossellomorea]TYR76161.1 hypothetical protein FZC79_08400 [Rossellomorea vietnamensis]TYS74082.1 hypothetical protein FZC80_18825 [Rossellomorea aquimaris]